MARVKDAVIDAHNAGYEKMTVHELVGYLVYAPDNLNIHVTCMHDYSKDHDIIESALRKAVIREASVGTIYVARDYDDGCPEFRFKCPESLTGIKGQQVCKLCGELIPERNYDLIPHKETT